MVAGRDQHRADASNGSRTARRDVTTDPYIDTESGVLRNRLGITDEEKLRRAEADLTYAALADLRIRILPGGYDLRHLCAFHLEIFGDIYPWAGEVRTIGIARTEPFCLPSHIDSYAAQVFGQLATENFLRGATRQVFVDRLTHFLAEVNAIHPFHEGNGRAQRAFFGQLARQAGHPIDWSLLDPVENATASRLWLVGDNRPLRGLLDRLVQPE
ncbi:Fic/DOC family protein [Nocardia grenadensis]